LKHLVANRDRGYAGYLTVERLTIRLPDGRLALREVESHGNAVAVLPYDPERRTALIVSQFRAPVFATTGEESIVEACAGMIEDGNAEATVRREAAEELGLRVGVLEFVARVWPSPGVSTEQASLFLAPYRAADRVGPGGGVESEHEDITVLEVSLSVLASDADGGRIVDMKLLTLVSAMRLRHPALFS